MLISMLIYTFGPSMIAMLVAMAGGAAWSGRGAPLLMIFEFYRMHFITASNSFHIALCILISLTQA